MKQQRKWYHKAAAVFLMAVFSLSAPFQIRAKQLTLPDGKSITLPDGKSITLPDGKSITLPDEVKKVVCFYGPSFEKVVLLGAASKIVLSSVFHKKAWNWSNVIYKDTEHIRTTTSFSNPNIEELLKIKPDVVFFWNKPEVVKMLNNIGISVIYPSGTVGTELEDAKNLLLIYARALGEKEKRIADRYCTYFDKKLKMVKDIVSTIPESTKPRVYFSIRKSLCSGGKHTILPKIIRAAGGKCVTENISLNYGGSVSAEQILAWNPEFVIMDHCGFKKVGSGPAEDMAEELIRDEKFSTVKAVKEKKIFISPTGVFFWDAGQQVILQVMWLAKILHPDKFAHINMENELKSFYSTFFRYDLQDDEIYKILNHLPPLKKAD